MHFYEVVAYHSIVLLSYYIHQLHIHITNIVVSKLGQTSVCF